MSHRSIAQPILGTQLVNAISMKHPCVLKCNYTPDDVLFNGLNPVLEKDAAREPGRGRPDGVDAADLSSSVCFLLPASMLKGRNQTGDGVALPDALSVAEPPRNGEAPACNHHTSGP